MFAMLRMSLNTNRALLIYTQAVMSGRLSSSIGKLAVMKEAPESVPRTEGRSPHLRLADIPKGGRAIIESLPETTAFGRRLMEIGLLPGSEVTVVGRAPMRDPIQIRVLGALIAIRRHEALDVEVSLIQDDLRR